MKPILSVQPPPRPVLPRDFPPTQGGNVEPSTGIDAFANVLTNQVKNVNTMQVDANEMVHTMLTGGDVNEAEVLTAVQKADLAFRMLLQVRNKLIEAYREVQQIQI